MKFKLVFLLVVIALLTTYLLLRPKTISLAPEAEVLAGCKTTEWFDALLMRPVVRIESETQFTAEKMFKIAEYVRSSKTNPHLSILFREQDKRTDYARIEFPGLIMTEL